MRTDSDNIRVEENIRGRRQAFSYSQLHSALSEADYIFVSVPLTDETKQQIGAAAIDTWYQYPFAENQKPFPSAKNDFQTLNNIKSLNMTWSTPNLRT